MAAIGGGLLGLALGNQLGGNKLLPSKTNTVLYITGGALSVTGITITVVWDPVSGIGEVYNAELSRQLDLPVPPSPGSKRP
jgi:hypothetical protein